MSLSINSTVLIVDDEPGILKVVSAFLKENGYHVRTAPHLAEAKRVMSEEMIDAVVLDYNLPDGLGIEWIPFLRSKFPALAIIMITGEGDIPLAVKAMQFGADHFIAKPVQLRDLLVFLKKSLEVRNLRKQSMYSKRLRKTIQPFWGTGDLMLQVRKLTNVAAGSEAPVLLLGETGTGKGVLANWIHEQSGRNSGAFVEINCTSLRGELLVSELFGHKKGAFTSAVDDKQGLVEVAHGGTLFLDEIGDMDLEIQAQFLKVIEEKQYRRLGDTKIVRSDFRLICATNQDLQQAIDAGRFRQDLFYRINVFPILLPALRNRIEDIPDLAQFLLNQIGAKDRSIAPAAIDILTHYPWPGNIREMRNVLERALLLTDDVQLRPGNLLNLSATVPDGTHNPGDVTLDAAESRHIEKILIQYANDTQLAAEKLGISRASLYRKMNKFGLK